MADPMAPAGEESPRERRFASEQMMMELGQTLIERGIVSREQINELNARRAILNTPLDRMLVKEGMADESVVLTALSELSGIPFRHIGEFRIDAAVAHRMQARTAIRYEVMPVDVKGGIMTLATSRVPSLSESDGLRMLLDMALDWVLCTQNDISKTLKHFYGLGAETIDTLVSDLPSVDQFDLAGTDVSAENADEGVVRFVNQIISEAIRMGATDIHIEPFENRLRLRYRIDGLLQEIPVPKGVAHLRKAIASCVKIMAEMNIAERRLPHDGRIKVRAAGDEFDLRVSILPSAYGETVNMRLLNRKTMFIDLEHLGLTEAQRPSIEYLSSMSHGVVLLTGPTGSGKTTTLYATLSRINTSDVKIITVEDPIEYQMEGINQIQVHAHIGLTFASVLRSILRHDPDIILIGEIRDMETADIAVRASLTGHLVFSTLHTNDAPSAITRLIDMGVEPYLVSSCLEGVIAQRLVRLVCAACHETVAIDDVILDEIRSMFPQERVDAARFLKGRGCPDCNFTGYHGRIALFEIMILNDVLRSMVVHQRPSNEIKKSAMEHGLVTLRKDGWNRVIQGMTTVEEVLRVARKADNI
jgi:type II secretory ATPase GspE/PulE/Tfp pilus assembly ATPase PilB-like protein